MVRLRRYIRPRNFVRVSCGARCLTIVGADRLAPGGSQNFAVKIRELPLIEDRVFVRLDLLTALARSFTVQLTPDTALFSCVKVAKF